MRRTVLVDALHTMRCVLSVALVGFGGAAQPAAAFQTEVRVLIGDAAPSTGAGTFSSFTGDVSINAAGRIAFGAGVSGGTTTEGVFSFGESSSTARAEALVGEIAPGTGGGTYASFGHVSIGNGGHIAFRADVSGGSTTRGLFVIDPDRVVRAAALVGDTAPGTGGGTFSTFHGVPALNSSGEMAFHGDATGGTNPGGIFVVSATGVVSERAIELESAPGTGAGLWYLTPWSDPDLSDTGSVVFFSDVVLGTVNEGIFAVDSAGVATAVALDGQPAPGSGGSFLGFFGLPRINAAGAIGFPAFVAPGQGIYVVDAGGMREVAVEGEAAPGSGGGTYHGFSNPAVDDFGGVAFSGSIDGSSAEYGLFRVDAVGNSSMVALEGDFPAGGGGGSFLTFVDTTGNATGDIACKVSLSGGSAGTGLAVFRQGPPVLPGGVLYAADAAASLGTNPAGAWQYGWMAAPGATLVPYPLSGNFRGEIETWYDPVHPSGLPTYNYNADAASYISATADSVSPGQSSVLHPGPNGEVSVMRFTAPAGGEYLLSGRFVAIDSDSTSIGAFIRDVTAGTDLFSAELVGYPADAWHQESLQLSAGSAIDFYVTPGSDAYWNDAVWVDAALVRTDQALPSAGALSLAVLCASLLAMGARFSRRNR